MMDVILSAALLYDVMSEFSEKRCFAGWLNGFEVHLYHDVFHNGTAFELLPAERKRFQHIAHNANGWWYCEPGSSDPRFMSLEEMDEIVGLNYSSRSRKLQA